MRREAIEAAERRLRDAKRACVEADKAHWVARNVVTDCELMLAELKGEPEPEPKVIADGLSKKQADHLKLALDNFFEDETFEVKKGKTRNHPYYITSNMGKIDTGSNAFALAYSYAIGLWSY